MEAQKIEVGIKQKCPACGHKLFNIVGISTGFRVECHQCHRAAFGIKHKPLEEPKAPEQHAEVPAQ